MKSKTVFRLCTNVYFCDSLGKYVEFEVVANPDYVPYLRFQARNINSSNNVLDRDRFAFVHHANGRLWILRTANMKLRKVKHNKKCYRKLVNEVRGYEILIWNMEREFEDQKRNRKFTVYPKRALLGYKGQSVLKTGYIYAPYVPLLVSGPSGVHPPYNKNFQRLTKLISQPVNLGISSRGVKKTP